MKIAAAYIRVSTDDQLEYSPDSQLEKIRLYVKQNNMILPEEYIFREEEGISGRKAERRPEFQRMIGTAKKKPKRFDVIVVWKFSRFARNRQDSIVYKSMLRKQCDIDVVSVTEQLGDDKMSIIIEAMIEAMDEYYSINLSEEVKRGMNEKVNRGEPVAIPAFGYNIENKKYIIDPDTAPTVKKIFSDFVSGYGYRDIACNLNAMGIRTKRGGLWENRTVEYVLRNPVYIGKIRWNPTGKTHRKYADPNVVISEGEHQHIISDELWEEAQRKAEQMKQMYGKYNRTRSSGSMLQGLVKCSTCGATVSRMTETSMQCNKYSRGKCNVSHYISTAKLEKLVLSAIDKSLKENTFLVIRKKYSQDNTDLIEKQIVREKQKLVRIKEAYQTGIDTIEEYRENKTKIMDHIAALEQQLKQDHTPTEKIEQTFISQNKKSIEKVFDPSIQAAEKNQILRTFVDHTVFDRASCSVKIYYYV